MHRARRSRALRLGAAGLALSGTVQGLGIATGVLTARFLGPDDRGTLALLFLLPTIVSYLSDLGTDRAAAFFAGRDVLPAGRLPSTLAVLGVVQGTLGAAVCAPIAYLILSGRMSSPELGLVAAGLVPLATLSRLGQAQIQGELRMRELALARAAYPIASVGLLALLAATQQLSIGSALMVRFAAEFLIVAITWWSVLRRVPLLAPDLATARHLLRYGLRGYVTKLSPNDVLSIDQWAVGLALGPRELGYYVVGLAALGPTRVIPTGLSTVMLPMAARGGSERRSAHRLAAYGIVAAVVVAVAMVPAASIGVPWLFGAEFQPAVRPTRIIIVGSAFFAARELLVALFYGEGRPGLASLVEAVSAVALLTLIIPFSREWGVNGAAATLCASYMGGFVMAAALRLRRGAE